MNLSTWNAEASGRFNRFIQELSRKMGADFLTYDAEGRARRVRGLTYFKAAEVQRRGALHFHLMIRRLDGKPFRASASLVRRVALKHGFGHSVDVKRLEPGHAQYVAKYVAKAADSRQAVPWIKTKVVRDHVHEGDAATGEIFSTTTVERTVTSFDASYRTWSKARSWGRDMREVREDQQHHVLTLLALPCWSERSSSPGWSLLDVPRRESYLAALDPLPE